MDEECGVLPLERQSTFYRTIDHDQNQNIKVDIPHCTREKQPKEVLNRLNEVERVSKFLNLPENERGKLVAIKLNGYASSKW